ncbi:MAG: Fur family transcriptional regulator [Lachnospiraceae bacterium]|nr:Fur family transcriptional regulator [Lachnospiraceae bacterium]
MAGDTEKYRDLLKKYGCKVTKQRILVLRTLEEKPDSHMTAEEIYDEIKVDFPEIGLATVYRTIQLLSELHLINRMQVDDGYTRYEIGHLEEPVGKHHHHHLVCLQCHKIISFEEDLLEGLEKSIGEKTGFVVVDHEVTLYGYCKECGGKLIEKTTT